MKIKYLGTAAAEGVPSLFCMCDVCRHAWMNKGRNIRTRSQALVNDELLIDFNADTYSHTITQELHLEYIHHLIVTHSHDDHFYPTDFMYRRKGFASVVEKEPFHVYGTTPVYEATKKVIEDEKMPEYLTAHLLIPYTTYDILNYKVTPLTANHDQTAGAVIYYIKQDNKSMLYAHDTGWFPSQTFEFLKNIDKPLDLLSLDCTACLLTGWKDGHLSFDTFLKLVDELKTMNVVDENTIIIANHFSHNGKASYEDMKKEADKYNVLVSYDGMEVEF